jgi:hypothetical protein
VCSFVATAGALQLFLQAGFLCLLAYQFMRDKAFHWVRTAVRREPGQQQQQQFSSDGLHHHPAMILEGYGSQTGQPSFTHVQGCNVAAQQLFLDPATGQLLLLNSPAGAAPPSIFKQMHMHDNANAVHISSSHAAAHHHHHQAHTSRLANGRHSVEGSPDTHSQPVRSAFNSMLHSLGKGLAAISVDGSGRRGVSSGGHVSPGAHNVLASGARVPPGLIITSSTGGFSSDGSA